MGATATAPRIGEDEAAIIGDCPSMPEPKRKGHDVGRGWSDGL